MKFQLHFRINTDLNGWFERHLKLFGNRNSAENPETKTKYTASQLRNLNVNLQKPTYLKDMLEKRALLDAFEIHNDKNDVSIKTTQTAKERRLMSNEKRNRPSILTQAQKEVYPISLYNTQTKQHEGFMKSIRQRNDTFYYVSFRRVIIQIFF